jgi:glutamate racemase
MSNAYSSPVGIFDSGLGGLSVLRDVRALLPHESLIYLADSKYAPIGDKPESFVEARTVQVCQWLIDQGCKALVIACNTATMHAVQELRERFKLPIVGVEPGLKPAAATTRSKVIGVLATSNTLKSAKFAKLHDSLRGEAHFLCEAGRGLVPHIEAGDVSSREVRAMLKGFLEPMLEAGADTLVLGCTHYPFLADTIRDLIGERMALIDTGPPIARQLQRKLDEFGLRAPDDAQPMHRFCSTKDAEHLRTMMSALLAVDTPAETVVIEPAPPFDDVSAQTPPIAGTAAPA